MGYGKPCIVSDVNQYSQLPDQICLKAPVGDKEQSTICNYLLDYIANKEKYVKMGQNAEKYVKLNCNWDRIAYEYYKLLKKY